MPTPVPIFDLSTAVGLSDAEVAERFRSDGYNEPVSYTHLTLPTNREV